MTRITIDPITRLEGHGKIDIFLDDQGDVADCFFIVPELRGFEAFCVGRPVEDALVEGCGDQQILRTVACHATLGAEQQTVERR